MKVYQFELLYLSLDACPSKLIKMIIPCRGGTIVKVAGNIAISDPFPFLNVVKQYCMDDDSTVQPTIHTHTYIVVC